MCYLEDLFVASEVRGRGVGRALIDGLVLLGSSTAGDAFIDIRTKTITLPVDYTTSSCRERITFVTMSSCNPAASAQGAALEVG